MTPSGGSQPYATPAEFMLMYDVRALGMLPDDTNSQVSPGSLSANATILLHLSRASGELEAACMVGSRYDPEDLLALTGNSRAFLAGIVCDLAYGDLRQRRGFPEPLPPAYMAAKQALQDLRDGKLIFGFAESEQAGLAQNRDKTEWEFSRQPWASRLRRAFGARLRDFGPPF